MAGIAPAEFWEITPWQLKIAIKAENNKRDYEQQARAWHAWHAAYLPRTKQPISLKKLSGQQSESGIDDAMLKASFRAYNNKLKDKGNKKS